MRDRARFISLPGTVLGDVEHWEGDIQRTQDSILGDEDAWTRYTTTGQPWPEGFNVSPGRKRVGEYRDLLARGEALEAQVRNLASSVPPISAEISRARHRVAARIELIVGELEPLAHHLQWLRVVNTLEPRLRDIDALATSFSHDDVQDMSSAEMGKNVIAYYRDTRSMVEQIRSLAKTYERVKTVGDAEDRLQTTLEQCQAYVAQNILGGSRLVQEIRAL
ncbi:MAG TPA: hypothetical protein VL332_07900 [Candidatus Saccharimonadaceae bacterium]|nr:hypothetical protein [Candidatus Saccharimonadaceae bacterium]